MWRLDGLGLSLKRLIDAVNELDACGVGFKSLTESIDTTTPDGRLVFHICGVLAELERELIREFTHAGLTARPRAQTWPSEKTCQGSGGNGTCPNP